MDSSVYVNLTWIFFIFILDAQFCKGGYHYYYYYYYNEYQGSYSGEIAGIVVGCIIGTVITAVIITICIKQHCKPSGVRGHSIHVRPQTRTVVTTMPYDQPFMTYQRPPSYYPPNPPPPYPGPNVLYPPTSAPVAKGQYPPTNGIVPSAPTVQTGNIPHSTNQG